MYTTAFALLPFALSSSSLTGQSSPQAAPELQSSSWYAQVSQDIREGEYAFQELQAAPGVFSAPNRAQDLRSRVSRDGLEVFPREASADGAGAAWKLQLSTKCFGRLDDLRELGAASIASNENRIELDRGLLHEWFVNGEQGLEQGFKIATRPSGIEPLWIGLEFAGDLSLRIDDSAHSGVMVDAGGAAKLRYRDLAVLDATGRELDARLEPSPSGVGIQIDDADAVYPLTVDPVLTGPTWTAESDQADADFGWSVATAGDVNGDGFSDVIVGASLYDNGQFDEGRAFLYLGSAGGLSTSATWTAESDQVSAIFGKSVSTAGDVNGDGYSDVIVGAYGYDNGQIDEGRAFVYLGSAAGLGASAAWTAESNQASAIFGGSVATAGDVNGDGYSDVIIGANQYDGGQNDEGGAFVYMGSATGLATSAAWTAESDQADALFGFSVATAGDVNGDGYSDVIVGAYQYDSGQTDEGRAFVYMGSTAGLAASAAWIGDGQQIDAFFGYSVATAGNVNGDGYSDVIIGAPFFGNGEVYEGRAVVYLGSPAGLATSSSWAVESNQTDAELGWSVSTAGDVNGDGFSDVIIGAPFFVNGQTDEGRAFLYLGSQGMSTTPAWTAESDQASAFFGSSVATVGDVNGDGYSDVVVGAFAYDNGQSNEGRAFLYQGSAAGLKTSPSWIAENHQANAGLGISVATAGDVNGDGYSDVIVGEYQYDNGQADEGRASVYMGSALGILATPSWTAESDQASAFFGWSVATAGDVNSDGYGDVIVGALTYDNGQFDEGRAFLYLGSATGLSASSAWTAEGDQDFAAFGIAVSSAGDLNGDGYGDVVVGASDYDNGQASEGRAFVYLGSASGLAGSAAWTGESNQTGARFGWSVAGAGDVNGDGFGDLIVGADAYDNGQTNEGRAYVYVGSASGLAASPGWTTESNQASAEYGDCVATAGDVNGDGYSDVLVGALQYDNGQSGEGRAFAYLGSANGLSTSPAWTAESDQANAFFGHSVATAGDINGDGYSDVIVGAYQYDGGESNEGRAFLYLGSASGLATSPAWTAESDQVGASYGYSVSTAGDVNGDGYSDVIVGAYLYEHGQTDEGRAFAYTGNDGRGGWTFAQQQRQATDVTPISVFGRSDSKNAFRIRLGFQRSLAGFEWATPSAPEARLEWQVARLGVPLGSVAIKSGLDQPITGLPLIFDELADFGLQTTPRRPYHWRVRLRTNNPLLPVTPWVSMPGNNVTESKLRRPPFFP